MNGPVFHVITAVWGGEFIELFLTTAIPNQLGAGNLAAVPAGSRYRIFTTAADRAWLESADAVQALRAVLPVDIVAMDESEEEAAKYGRMIRFHRKAVEDALGSGAALIFLSPDHVLAAGTMARLVDIHARGYRAAVCPGLWLAKESMLAALAQQHAAALPPRALVAIALQHLHPSMSAYMADAVAFSPHPTSVYWRVGETGLLARCMTLHPLMVDPVRARLPSKEIDSDYVWRCVPDLAMVHVVTDSDELVIFEMTRASAEKATPGRRSWSRVWRTASVAARCDSHQLAYWRRAIRVHSTDLDAAWTDLETDSARFAERVLWRLPYIRRALPLVDGSSRWQQRYDRRARNWRRRLPRIRMKQIKRLLRLAIGQSRKRVRRAFRLRRRRGCGGCPSCACMARSTTYVGPPRQQRLRRQLP